MSDFWRSPLDPERVINTRVTHWQDGEQEQREEYLTVEEPLEIRLGGRKLAVIMRTPGHDEELAAGFLLTEGIIEDADDLLAVRTASDSDGLPLPNVVEVIVSEQQMREIGESAFTRHFAVSASCGLCGRDSIDAVLRNSVPVEANDLRIDAERLYDLPARLRESQAIFTHTGGLHAAGLFDERGELVLLREDVGRHNAVDKLIGHGLLQRTLPYARSLLLVSGRTSFEIIQKALRARIPCIAAISAPSSLAVELAEESGITLIGFLRARTMNVYAHAERIVPAPLAWAGG
jgi:FdhD protein